jgi:hypothetical protein
MKYAADSGYQQCPLHDGTAAYEESEQCLRLAESCCLKKSALATRRRMLGW